MNPFNNEPTVGVFCEATFPSEQSIEQLDPTIKLIAELARESGYLNSTRFYLSDKVGEISRAIEQAKQDIAKYRVDADYYKRLYRIAVSDNEVLLKKVAKLTPKKPAKKAKKATQGKK